GGRVGQIQRVVAAAAGGAEADLKGVREASRESRGAQAGELVAAGVVGGVGEVAVGVHGDGRGRGHSGAGAAAGQLALLKAVEGADFAGQRAERGGRHFLLVGDLLELL